MEEDYENFKQEAAFIEEDLRNQNSQLKYAVDSRDKEIQNLKNILQELKFNFAKREDEFTKKYDSLSITYKQEK